jgi:LmbE family N-acetylglucosaminyl deacetylase
MAEQLRLMCVLAHPDDESLGVGGILAKHAAEGVATYLVTATRGERGWTGAEQDNPGLEGLGKIREAELLAAAQVLGLREVRFLNYIDGDLDQADPPQAVTRIVGHLRRVKPHVVVTFDPFGAYGHPDHIAISQLTTAACVCAADPTYSDGAPHRVSKLYYMAGSKALIDVYQSIFGDVVMRVDGVERRAVPWEDWAITTRIDTGAHWRTVGRAISCHRSQLPGYAGLEDALEQQHEVLLGSQTFYRAFSLVNGGRQVERDLFEGLR